MPRTRKTSKAKSASRSADSSPSPYTSEEQQIETESRFHNAIAQEETRNLRKTSHDYTALTPDNPLSGLPHRESFAQFLFLALNRRQLLSMYLFVAQDTYSTEQLDSMTLAQLENIYSLLCTDLITTQ